MDQAVIPVIDLLNLPAENQKLLTACEGIGCFRVINHGITVELLAEMKTAGMALFDLPDDIKRRNVGVIPASGYRPLTKENPLYEALGVYDAASLVDVDDFCSQLGVSPMTREIIKTYACKVHGLILKIASIVAESLGLCGYSFKDWPCQSRINKYHFTQEAIGSPAIPIHTDSGFLTILQEDDSVGGLEIMDMSGKFLSVDPVPGSLLVNLGDMAKAWSNGRLHNVKHRVLCKEAAPRITIALFLLAPKDDTIVPPASLVDSVHHPRIYRTFTYEEYRNLLISSRLFAGETLSLFATEAPKV